MQQVIAEPRLTEFKADEIRIAQVRGNLVNNALRRTPNSGRIFLSAQRQAGQMKMSVEDNGADIAPDELLRIFERSGRADPSRHSES